MVDPEQVRVAAELAARGTDASPLEAVLEPAAEDDFERDRSAEGDPEPAPMSLGAEEEATLEPSAPLGEPFSLAMGDSLYDALGVNPQASREQIEKAYRFCLDMYKEGALATYSLVEAGDAESARRRISLAHETLSDPQRRREYDLGQGLTPLVPEDNPFLAAEAQAAAAPSDAPSTLPAGPLSGAELRRIRESRGIALREIAVSSKIGLRFLEYIEEDRFAVLPPAVYLRGFLQEYARALGLDPRRAADSYMSRMGR
ncbi:MAG TPA: helix-turn-helix domain-containing protein [Vicinamibacteria bacterium]